METSGYGADVCGGGRKDEKEEKGEKKEKEEGDGKWEGARGPEGRAQRKSGIGFRSS
ncbi:hypothetical protein GCM10027160_16780 [Streptomyces calidiresistens]